MAYTAVRKFACDRCGEKEEVPFADQPDGWGFVIVGRPVLATDDSGERWELCESCTNTVDECLGLRI